MILLLSKSDFDSTTEDIIDWLLFFDEKFIRVNGEQFMNDINFCRCETSVGTTLSLKYNGEIVNLKSVKNKIWLRRRYSSFIFEQLKISLNQVALDKGGSFNLIKHTAEEFRAFYDLFEHHLSKYFELVPNRLQVDKVNILSVAREAGFLIPETFVGNCKEDVLNFVQKLQNKVIVKPLTDVAHFYSGKYLYKMFTSKLSKDEIDALDANFFPVLIQEYIDKLFELRIFYLDGECYAMAIFSQQKQSSQIDFRDFDFSDPVRFVPYKLTNNLKKRIKKFMKLVNLKMGSIDIIKDKKNNYFFLEVNPSGQFGFESLYCNYGLEKKVSEYLINP